MAYTTINKSTDYFNTLLHAGNGSSPRALTGVGFQPDWVWTKNRSAANSNTLGDAVRGTGKTLFSDSNSAELTNNTYGYHSAFASDGFSLTGSAGSAGGDNVNKSGNNYVNWCWKANGAGSSNTDGSITSTVSANTTAGFSIVSYTGTAANATVGHGLGSAPNVIFFKSRGNASTNWYVYHSSLGHGTRITLNTTSASASDTEYMNNTAPTSSVFSLGANGTTNPSTTQIAYCFAEKAGYSKFGSYTGNGNNDGAFVYTGFKPAWVMIKKTTADGWQMFDNKRDPYNAAYHRIEADSSAGDYTGLSAGWIDMVSNGFKVRYNGGGVGTSGVSYIYMAFGQSLVGSNNIPCTAR